MKVIVGKIDVTKIDKKRLFKGTKGTYLNFSMILNDTDDKYGNHGFISESVSREEREQGMKGTVLGNVKIVFDKPDREPGEDDDKGEEQPTMNDDLPF